jgi:TetR/AcrR family fatty acid metabolism transcriptional regulator
VSAARRLAPEVRREQLVAAAAECFREQGVSDTAVSNIVKRAGVAQGTFYLYFDSKEEIVTAVISRALDEQVVRVSRHVEQPDASAIEKLVFLQDALVGLRDEPHEQEALAIFHRPENKPIHDRISAGFAERMVPHVKTIIEQGVAEGSFEVSDPELAAWFILGSFMAVDSVPGDPEALRRLGAELTRYAARGLGYAGSLPL